MHDRGDNVSFFNRFDFHPGATDTLHLNVQAAQSEFDVPNTYDQIAQTQHQKITTFNIAPGYSSVIGSNTLFTANGFVRQDHLTTRPAPNPLDDTPAHGESGSHADEHGCQSRHVAITLGHHNMKFGGTISATRLHEQFTFGITDPTDAAFAGRGRHTSTRRSRPFDLTNGGSPLAYDQSLHDQGAGGYIQDDIKAGNATFKLGLRSTTTMA